MQVQLAAHQSQHGIHPLSIIQQLLFKGKKPFSYASQLISITWDG